MLRVKFKKLFVGGLLFYILTAILEPIFSIYLGKVIDAANNKNFNELLNNVGFAIVLIIGATIASCIAIFFSSNFVTKNIKFLKDSLAFNILDKNFQDFTKNEEAYYLNLFNNDFEIIENDYFQRILDQISQAFLLFFSMSTLIYIDIKMSISFIIMFLLPMFISQLFGKRLEYYKLYMSEANEQYNSTVKELTEGYYTIITTSTKKFILNKFFINSNKQQIAHYKSQSSLKYINEITACTSSVSHLGCIGIGGYFVFKGNISVGELIAAIQLLNTVFRPINLIAQNATAIRSSRKIRDKIYKELEKSNNTNGIKLLPEKDLSVSFENITFGFEKKKLYTNLSFNIPAGSTCAIIGESGVGKSTLIKLILRQYIPWSGNIKVASIDLDHINQDDLYKKISIVSQFPYLFNDSIWNNILLGEQITDNEKENIIQLTGIRNLLDEFGEEKLGDNGSKISGGERQKIALARVLVRHIRLIIFDEPTAALDPENKRQIQDLIFSLNGITRIVITHDRDKAFLGRFDKIIEVLNEQELEISD